MNPLTPEQARKVLSADLANLIKKVASGKTLTNAERQLVEHAAQTGGGSAPPVSGMAYVSTKSDLADALGMSRQRLHPWTRRDDAPGRLPDGRYSVAEWAKYFRDRGVPVGQAKGQGNYTHLTFGDGCYRAADVIAPAIVAGIADAKIKLTPGQRDKLAMLIWLRAASQIDEAAMRFGSPSYFEPGDDGQVYYPPCIVEVANRLKG